MVFWLVLILNQQDLYVRDWDQDWCQAQALHCVSYKSLLQVARKAHGSSNTAAHIVVSGRTVYLQSKFQAIYILIYPVHIILK